jgi:threonine synthase
MDVALPSNFVRILQIFDGDMVRLKETMTAVSVSDEETKLTMKSVFEKNGYVMDPHGAVGYRALDNYLGNTDASGIFLETAHPVKFQSVKNILGTYGEVPESVTEMLDLPKNFVEIDPDYESVKAIIARAA